MKVKLPFFYQANLLKPGHQYPAKYWLLAEHSFEIKEMLDKNAPIAASLLFKTEVSVSDHQTKRFATFTDYRLTGDQLLNTTKFDIQGKYGKSSLEDVTVENIEKLSVEFKDSCLQAPKKSRLQTVSVLWPWNIIRLPVEDEVYHLKNSKWLESGKQTMIDKLQSRADCCAVIGGKIYTPGFGPAITVSWEERIEDHDNGIDCDAYTDAVINIFPYGLDIGSAAKFSSLDEILNLEKECQKSLGNGETVYYDFSSDQKITGCFQQKAEQKKFINAISRVLYRANLALHHFSRDKILEYTDLQLLMDECLITTHVSSISLQVMLNKAVALSNETMLLGDTKSRLNHSHPLHKWLDNKEKQENYDPSVIQLSVEDIEEPWILK